jgi:predicted unusual protein kinase regulating ubiquinone biosynthesis (AarF/ABC1/UbiB family)
MYQIHHLKKFHADPHPGNFLVSEDNQLTVLDFGCVKSIPDEFYVPYFELAQQENIDNAALFKAKLYELEILQTDDSPQEIDFLTGMFHKLLTFFTQPFQNETFDFSNSSFFTELIELGSQYSKNTELRNMNSNRGSRHFIYVNRTFFGLYNLMHMLKADNIKINNYLPKAKTSIAA